MRRLEVGTTIAVGLLVAACAGSPQHAPVQRPVTGSPQVHSVLRNAARQPSWRQFSGACGRSVSTDRGGGPAEDAPCTPTLLVPVTVPGSRTSRPHVVYRRRLCLC